MLQTDGAVRGAGASGTGERSALACWSRLALLGLALAAPLVLAAPVEVGADIIWDNADAANKCPQLCSAKHLYWMGTWHKTGWAETPVCACDDHPQPPPPQLPPGAPGFPQGLPGMPQMAPVAPPPMHNGAVLRYDNTDFPGFDLRNFSAGSFENCADMCGASADCRAFTYAADQHRCYLKSAASSAQPAGAAISGVLQARGSPPPGAYPGGMQGGYAPMPPQMGTSCSVASTPKCPGCSVSCAPGQKAVCDQAVEGVTSWCARNASCRCS
jgi:hypothetical protein